jgi:uncharacterized protein (DUF1015 family)
MVKIFRFFGIRPRKEEAAEIASVPYDVVSREEAQDLIKQNPKTFLQVIRSDAEFPRTSSYDDGVYFRARENLDGMMAEELFVWDSKPCMYLYRVKQGGALYTGLVTCIGTEEYVQNRIRRHEHTRYDKEADRSRHIDVTNANTGLVVLLYRDLGNLFSYIESLIPSHEPDAMVKTPQGVVHELFVISDNDGLARLEACFADVDSLYIADGHHRAKSAVNVAELRRARGTISPDSERFMAILFAANRVKIHGYSRLITDLGSYSHDTFLDALSAKFSVRKYGEIDDTVFCIPPLHEFSRPHHVIHMYFDGIWYELARPVANSDDLVGSLDVTVLQDEVLGSMLGIQDPRSDPRLQYLGGARFLSDLEERVDSGEFMVAFSLQPVSIETVLQIADQGGVMPPKSTWFEPKLLSGLVLHSLE